jgi:hypothetical protein
VQGDRIPDSDNIARLCMPKTAEDGIIQASAFILREDEPGLSVNWLEFLECPDRATEIVEMQRVYARKLTVGRSARIAILNVGEICELVYRETEDNRIIEVLHTPDELHNDPSHSEIMNLRPDNEFIAELIHEIILETHPAR